jgi:hypothetical protein
MLTFVLDTETAWLGFVFHKLNCILPQLITSCLKNNLYSEECIFDYYRKLVERVSLMAGGLLAFKTCWKILCSMFASINEHSVSHTITLHGSSVVSDD